MFPAFKPKEGECKTCGSCLAQLTAYPLSSLCKLGNLVQSCKWEWKKLPFGNTFYHKTNGYHICYHSNRVEQGIPVIIIKWMLNFKSIFGQWNVKHDFKIMLKRSMVWCIQSSLGSNNAWWCLTSIFRHVNVDRKGYC